MLSSPHISCTVHVHRMLCRVHFAFLHNTSRKFERRVPRIERYHPHNSNSNTDMLVTVDCANPTRTCSGPMPLPSEIPTSFDTPVLDAHTIPIIFGTIGVVLATISLVVNIAFGMLQLRAIKQRARIRVEAGKVSTEAAHAGIEPTSRIVATTNQQHHMYQLRDELSTPVTVRYGTSCLYLYCHVH
jgi:hypothetical protein